MRQAGRYLPEYRAVRRKVDFLTLCKTPDLAAEVTIQPVDRVGVDAAILFSDILVVPEAMGMELSIEEGKGGPRFRVPVRSSEDIARLRVADPSALQFVLDAVRVTQRNLRRRVPLIGFSGSPWTLAAYMVEGAGSGDFRRAKSLLYTHPRVMHGLLEKVSDTVSAYLASQIEAGVDALQIFDTWGGVLCHDEFVEFSLRYMERVVQAIRGSVPVIVFSKDGGGVLREIASIGADVVGLDWKTDIGEARAAIGNRVALQGNLDPVMLLSTPARIEEGVRAILAKFGKGEGHVFNLGHGVLPETPVENALAFVEAVKKFSPEYH